MKRHETVDQYIASTPEWKVELSELRSILLSTDLEETVKWGSPVYTFEGRTKALRQWRLESSRQIDRKLIKSYVKEAIGLVKRGVEIKPARNEPVTVPVELQTALRKHKKAKTSFDRMTLGKRREYVEYITSAKRDETKQKRIDKILPMIESGVWLNDKYRDC